MTLQLYGMMGSMRLLDVGGKVPLCLGCVGSSGSNFSIDNNWGGRTEVYTVILE